VGLLPTRRGPCRHAKARGARNLRGRGGRRGTVAGGQGLARAAAGRSFRSGLGRGRGHCRRRYGGTQGSAPAHFLPARYSCRPVQDRLPVLPRLGDDFDRARDSQRADLHGLPPALFTVGAADPLADDTYFMETRWRMAGNRTYLAVYPEAGHGVDILPTKMGKLAQAKMYQWINDLCK